MADDGMLLNFAVSNAQSSLLSRRKFEGGSWKDRARAKKRQSLRQSTGDKPRESDGQVSANLVPLAKFEQDFPETRPAKRRKEDGTDEATISQPLIKPRQTGQRQTGAARDFVSSLFTYNPKSAQSAPEKKDVETEEKPGKPSNAPLIDGIDTFTSLGLSSTIAAHLLTKMDLKNPTAIQKAAISQMLKEEGDAFIQSETGSGKTLAYLLPIVQRVMELSKQQTQEATNGNDNDKALHRDSGLFAIVLAPTRELCKQISVVLERLLGCAHYIVAGTVIGGEKKKSEKARLRKGINILVATPGRLVDHLENTEVLDVSYVRWLVLDEGDRLMDLGFEQDITKITTTLDRKRQKLSRIGLPDNRTTVLCSATLKMNVQKLGDITLRNAALIKGDTDDTEQGSNAKIETADTAFLAPAQLKQSYLVVPAKLRLVTLTALLRQTFARKGSVNKAIVFLSCADSVDFHFKVCTRPLTTSGDESNDELSNQSPDPTPSPIYSDETSSTAPSPLLSSQSQTLQIFRLHGSLPQATRTSITNQFRASTVPSLLLATDVASRGLDLPNLDLVIEYDPAFSSDDHLHRIGRTARLGRDGRAVVFLMPGKEEGYVNVLRASYKPSVEGAAVNITQNDSNEILKKGFSPTSGVVGTAKSSTTSTTNTSNSNSNSNSSPTKDWQQSATNFQNTLERWILETPETRDMAKRAFQSHIRAYATHTSKERKYFDIKELHLGHIAKAFGLREAPGRLNVVGLRQNGGGKGRFSSTNGDTRSSGGAARGVRDRLRNSESKGGMVRATGANAEVEGQSSAVDDAARKMRDLIKKQRMMGGGAGADEFNIA